MSWKFAKTLAWEEPLAFAGRFAGRGIALLYSGLREQFTGDVSYFFVDPIEECSGSDWAGLPPLPATGDPLPLWVGYLGYGMRNAQQRGHATPITLPDFRLVRYAHMLRFNHAQQSLEAYSHDGSSVSIPPAFTSPVQTPNILKLASNFTRAEYERVVAETIQQIRDGNFYQANITRKFFGKFETAPDSWQLFTALTTASPAPYSAYIRHGETAILSSSPECFLSIDARGVMTTRPIKGSARRSDDSSKDQQIKTQLAASEKNHAENLMIVDLMRNDLAQVSVPRSVEVIEQSALYSYSTIHHLISTVRAQKRSGISAYDAVRACFPAGSMTGAPKIAAVKWCAAKESMERGVYSGAIGWFGPANSCDLSVIIRTLILNSNQFEFQVGGGIIADSDPEDEWRETIAKTRGILMALNLKEDAVTTI